MISTQVQGGAENHMELPQDDQGDVQKYRGGDQKTTWKSHKFTRVMYKSRELQKTLCNC